MLNDQVRSRKTNSQPGRNESECAVGEADVPVGLRARRDGGRVVRSVVPDRVDREQRGDQHDHTERDEQEPAHLRHVHRHHRVAHDVAVRAARAGELRVLVDDHQHEVHDEQSDEDRRQQQDVQGVEATDDRRAGELASEQQERDPGADQRDALDHAVDDAQAVAREQVIGKRVPREALAHRQDEQHEADHPVQLTRLAERPGEEDAEHVDADAGDEHERGPVMDLPHEEAAAQIERYPQRRIQRRRHLDTAHRDEGTRVVRGHHRRLEEERQERSREQDDDEAPERDFAEHERPVIGEDLSAEFLDEPRQAGALVDIIRGCSKEAAAEGISVLPRREGGHVIPDCGCRDDVLRGVA